MTDATSHTSPDSAAPARPISNRPGLATALLVILLVTLPLLGLMYLGFRLLNLPFTPFDLYDWPIYAGFTPWAELIDAFTGSQAALGGNAGQNAAVVQWVLALGLFFGLALLVGMAFYLFVVRRDRAPDLISGLSLGLVFGAPLLFVSLTNSSSPLPALLKALWLAVLFIAWGVALSYVFARLMEPGPIAAAGEVEGGMGRRQFLLQFGAGAAAITAISATVGATLAPGRDAARLQRTLPMIQPEFAAAQSELFGNFRRFAIVRGGAESADESNVVALGAEYPDRNYVSIWLGGRSPIVIYESLESAVAAYSLEEDEDIGVFWLDE